MEWQRDEGSDAVFQVHQRLSEGGALPHFPVSFADGILDTPMPRQWSPGPQWARLASSVVADSEDKIHAGALAAANSSHALDRRPSTG